MEHTQETHTGQAKVITGQFRSLLREGFEGPQQDGWAYFTDPGSAGIIGTIRQLDASAASRKNGPHDNSIAAHVHHLAFALAASNRFLNGDRTPADWPSSWQVDKVDEQEWEQLQRQLRKEYENFMETVEQADVRDDMIFGGIAGAISHAAYHMGAIRQKLRADDLAQGLKRPV